MRLILAIRRSVKWKSVTDGLFLPEISSWILSITMSHAVMAQDSYSFNCRGHL